MKLHIALQLLPQKPDIIILTETWLSSRISNPELRPQDYVIYRCDSVYENEIEVGGGVLVAVRSSIQSNIIHTFDEDLEEIFVCVKSATKELIIGCTYITCRVDSTAYLSHTSRIEEIFTQHPNSKYLILGDYNLTNILWPDNKNSKLSQSGYVPPDLFLSAQ